MYGPLLLTVDEEHNLLYIPVSGPGAEFLRGGDRPGANLFGVNTLVALDVETGKMKWYFQTVHHELWDYNLPPAPTALVDTVKDVQEDPGAGAQVGKSGFMFILDRQTGKPVFGMEERPVDKSNVPGEASYPTQPIPVKPPPISRAKHDQGRYRDSRGHHAGACPRRARSCGTNSAAFTMRACYTTFPFHAERREHPARDRFSRCDGCVRIGAERQPIRRWSRFSPTLRTAR